MPPKMIINVSEVSITPIRLGGILNASSKAAQMVLLCTALKANPEVKISRKAKKKTWEVLNTHHPVHVMQIPQKKDEKSMVLWGKEVEEFNTHIEEVAGRELSFEEMKNATEIINAKRAALRRLDKLRGM